MRPRAIGGLVAAAAAVLCLAVPAAASAEEIFVETPADVSAANSECSLREAVQSANNNDAAGSGCETGDPAPMQDIIRLQAGTYPLLGAPDDMNLSGDLDYLGGGALAINGVANAAGVPLTTIDAPPADRLIDVPSNNPPSQLNLASLNLTDGRALGAGIQGDGGAIRVFDLDVDLQISGTRFTGNQAVRNGGAISYDFGDVFANVAIDNTEFANNAAGVNAIGSGGAIWMGVPDNEPLIESSAFIGNSATAVGGAVALTTTTEPDTTLRNSTFSGNTTDLGGSAVGFAGAAPGEASIEFSTFADNTGTTAGGGGVATAGVNQTVYLRSSILAGNTASGAAANCAGPGQFVSQTHNIESADTCSLVQAYPDLIDTDPLLAPLSLSTAPGASQISRTRGLYDGSPAIDFVPRTLPGDKCEAAMDVDQRGIPRPMGITALCDAGAFEGSVGPKPVPTPIVDPPLQPKGPPPTGEKKCPKGKKRKVVKGKVKCVKKKKRRK